jgi:hypothetical protein
VNPYTSRVTDTEVERFIDAAFSDEVIDRQYEVIADVASRLGIDPRDEANEEGLVELEDALATRQAIHFLEASGYTVTRTTDIEES